MNDFDIVVIGGTPGGIASAIAAARHGRRVVLTEYHAHIGGMSTSGLGKSDIEDPRLIRGIFAEFVDLVRAHYVRHGSPKDIELSQDGYYFEPSVAEACFDAMIAAEPNITLLRSHRLEGAATKDGTVTAVTVTDRTTSQSRTITAAAFIDATYEGDLFAAAGANFNIGRESRDEHGEPHAGVIYYDYGNNKFLPGTTHEGDHRLPAWTYRLCLTTDSKNAAPMSAPPEGYDRALYLPYLEDLAAGRLSAPKRLVPGRGYFPAHFDTPLRALSVTEVPGGKVDVNINPRPLAFPYPQENEGYLQADWDHREKIANRHRAIAEGLLWFLQNDTDISQAHRDMALEYHKPADEFADNGNFPWQLYIREGRRLKGLYTFTEHDVAETGSSEHTRRHEDAIAVGNFPIDSFPTRKRQPGDTIILEGYLGMVDAITRIYQVPYRIMIPETLDGVIVPVAVSATHVAFSTVRMEPTWMALGQAAGTAAHIALDRGCALRDVPVNALQTTLKEDGQVIDTAPFEEQ